MKNLKFRIIIALFCIVGNTANALSNDFQYDRVKLDLEMKELNKLEMIIISNSDSLSDYDYSELSSVIDSVNKVNNQRLFMGLTPFWFGFTATCIGNVITGGLLGPASILYVWDVSDHNKEETKKAFYGCLTSTGVTVAVPLVFVAVFFNVLNYY